MDSDSGQDVGAAGAALKLAMAREAVRQGELQMSAQVNHLQAAETRAISLLGWTNAAALAGAALVASHPFQLNVWATIAVASVASSALVTIVSCIAGLWPAKWVRQGTDVRWLLEQVQEDDNELSTLLRMAKRYAGVIDENERRLKDFTGLVRIAYVGFSLSAIFGIVIAMCFISFFQHLF